MFHIYPSVNATVISWKLPKHFQLSQRTTHHNRSTPKLFTAVADAIGWALLQPSVNLQIHYLDDFSFFVPPSAEHGQSMLCHTLNVLECLGVSVATQKIEGPATVVTFLAIEVDTVRFELRLPQEKIERTCNLVALWWGRCSRWCEDFESLVGHLSHVATVIQQGWIFLRQLYSVLAAVKSNHHYVHLSTSARADLDWWSYFLQHWNGTMFLQQPQTPMAHMYTDASGSFGCGGVLMSAQWFQIQWPPTWANIDICVKELVPVEHGGSCAVG